jgi:hypothetical protein
MTRITVAQFLAALAIALIGVGVGACAAYLGGW